MLDIKIVGGTVVDGTGAPGMRADVGIRDGRIVAIGAVNEPAGRTIDATGLVVAPGFVDSHTHYDAQVFWDPTLSPSCYHGVTTVMAGFCGFSIAPLTPEAATYLGPMLARVEGMPLKTLQQALSWDWTSFGDYLSRIDGRLGVNAGFMVGHSAVRRVVMGERAVGQRATEDDIERMCALVGTSIREGAMGFSSTISPTHNDADGNPVPSRHASREELLALAGVVRHHEGTALELLPNLAFDDSMIDLLVDYSLAGQRPVNWNVMSVNGADAPTRKNVARMLSASDRARERGAEVVALMFVSSPGLRLNFHSGFVLDSISPRWAEFFRLAPSWRQALLRDPAVRNDLCEEARGHRNARVVDWDHYLLMETGCADHARFVGRRLADIAGELGGSSFDALVDLALADDLKTSFMVNVPGEDAQTYAFRSELWQDDRTVVGASDAGAHMDMIDSFAFSTKLLQKGVREYRVIGLEQAVRQLTEVPARLFGLKERGNLREGWHADVVVFDPATVGHGEVYTRRDLPGDEGRLYADATGVPYVIVNGQLIVEGGRHTGALPGRVMKSGRDTRTVKIPAAA